MLTQINFESSPWREISATAEVIIRAIGAISNQIGSCCPSPKNFCLTPQVKRRSLKSCGKIRAEELDCCLKAFLNRVKKV